MRILPLATAFLLLLASPAFAADIEGRVVDAEGEPVAGIEVSTSWSSTGAGWTAGRPVRTEADGTFRHPADPRGRPMVLCALDVEGGRGGMVEVAGAGGDRTITLAGLTSVRLAVSCDALGVTPASALVRASYAGARLFSVTARNGEATLLLPPGAYEFTVRATDAEDGRTSVSVAAGQDAVDLGTLDLRPTKIALMRGKAAAPFHVTDAKNAPAGTQLEDYRGKWLLVEFWAHW